jgi:putative two-component system response regulator
MMLEMINDPEIDPREKLSQQNKSLQQTISALEKSNRDFIRRIHNTCMYKDNENGNHILRVGAISRFLADKAGMPPEIARLIGIAAPMHDIGKLGIPDSILYKPGKLTPSEFEIIKTHTLIGGNIFRSPKSPEMEHARQIALYHHERWDGKGYPSGLSQKNIPVSARIVAVADVFDALLSWRPYEEPTSEEKAGKIISQNKRILFDPIVVEVFSDNFEEICRIRNTAEHGFLPVEDLLLQERHG